MRRRKSQLKRREETEGEEEARYKGFSAAKRRRTKEASQK
jgi:hypothetical protein